MIRIYSKQTGLPINYVQSVFPGGEVHVRLEDFPDQAVGISALLKNSEDVMTLLLIKDALDQQGHYGVDLYLRYMPYARQDRVCNQGEAFSLKVMCNLINSCEFDEVVVEDPHSDVVLALLDRSTAIEQHDCIDIDVSEYDFIVSPDGGALKKIYKVAQEFGGVPVIEATKVRDPATTNIVATKVFVEDQRLEDKKLLVVDDICDGGRTFVELGKVLDKYKPSQIDLHVTHGIFSKGKSELYDWYDNIYSTNDWSE